jgi:TonB family protein
MGSDFRAALELIAANEARLAQLEAVLAPVSFKGAATDPSRKPARLRFDGCHQPEYPRAALRYDETGAVTLRFLLDADGRVQAVRKVKSSGHPQLDDAAMFWLGAWPFQPATVDGRPVATWQPVRYVWTLE